MQTLPNTRTAQVPSARYHTTCQRQATKKVGADGDACHASHAPREPCMCLCMPPCTTHTGRATLQSASCIMAGVRHHAHHSRAVSVHTRVHVRPSPAVHTCARTVPAVTVCDVCLLLRNACVPFWVQAQHTNSLFPPRSRVWAWCGRLVLTSRGTLARARRPASRCPGRSVTAPVCAACCHCQRA